MQRQDRADYEWLFRATFARVQRTVALVVRDRDRAEEIVQDAFLQLLVNWAKVSHYERPEAWVHRVAIRMAVRQAGRENARRPLEIRAEVRAPAPAPEPDLDLADAVAALAPMQRAAIVLHYYDDLPVLEVARVLGVSESTVKQHLHRARARLAERLSEEASDHVD